MLELNHNNLHTPYLIILAILAAMALSSYTILNLVLDEQQSDAAEINMSGRQRALSQRIALLSNSLWEYPSSSETKRAISELRLDIDLMYQSHFILTKGSIKDGISAPSTELLKALYFGLEVNLDREVRAYLTLAEKNLSLAEQEAINASGLKGYVFSIQVVNDILYKLDKATNQYQFESEQNLAQFKRYQLIALLVTLLVLVGSGLFVFRPMVIKIQSFIKFTKEEEARFRSITNSSAVAMIIATDHEGNIISWNRAAELIFGYEEADILGRSLTTIIPERYRQAHTEGMKRASTTGEHRIIGKTVELFGLRKNGEEFPLELSLGTWFRDDKRYYSAIIHDVTERNDNQAALRRSQKMDAIGELSGGLSHDFNNLLAIIIGNLDLMNWSIEDGSKLHNQLHSARHAALRGADITRRLLNFSSQSPEDHSPININAIIKNIEILVAKALTTNISIELNLDKNLWKVELAPGDFEDSIINLSLNARDAMPNGGKLYIETINTVLNEEIPSVNDKIKVGEYVKLTVSDTGTGMPASVINKVFEPYFTTKKSNKGTGLGLAMVYGFVQRCKGYIIVTSEENLGTNFQIFLPRSHGLAGKTHELNTEIDETLPTGNETILVVDDEKELAVLVESTLTALGYTVITSSSGDNAYEILKKNDAIDLIFSDIVMLGNMSGFDLADAATKLHPELKILLTSGYAKKIERTDISEEWKKNLVKKPYQLADLARRIRLLLDENQVG